MRGSTPLNPTVPPRHARVRRAGLSVAAFALATLAHAQSPAVPGAPLPPGVVSVVSASAPSASGTTAPNSPAALRGTILTAGDSLAQGYGMVLPTWLHGSGWTTVNAGKVGSGLSSTRLIDWDAQLPPMVTRYRPEVVLLSFGANDAGMPVRLNGKSYAYGTPGWHDAYAAKVAGIVRTAASTGATVIWMPVPPMLNARLEGMMGPIRQVQQEVVENAGALMAVAPGSIRSPSLRAKDGVHMTMTGYQMMVDTALRDAWARRGYTGYAYGHLTTASR